MIFILILYRIFFIMMLNLDSFYSCRVQQATHRQPLKAAKPSSTRSTADKRERVLKKSNAKPSSRTHKDLAQKAATIEVCPPIFYNSFQSLAKPTPHMGLFLFTYTGGRYGRSYGDRWSHRFDLPSRSSRSSNRCRPSGRGGMSVAIMWQFIVCLQAC